MRYTIKQLLPDAICEVTGKSGEAVLVESDDGLRDAIIRFPELEKMNRFRALQENKQATPTLVNRAAG